ncbi:hypothetical protein ABTM87_20285, partial [Acinetobacter baumannii]
FVAADVDDNTHYLNELHASPRSDDVLAARQAVAHYSGAKRDELARWVRKAGPLPADKEVRDQTINAVGRGLAELKE